MSSSSDGGINLPTPDADATARNDVANDASSQTGSSYIGSDGSQPSAQNTCCWRTDEFYDQECSRYFDCPSHHVERILSDSESSADEEETAPIDDAEHESSDDDHDGNHNDRQNLPLPIRSDSISSTSSSDLGHPSPADNLPSSSHPATTPGGGGSSSGPPREASTLSLDLPVRTSSLQSPSSLPPTTPSDSNVPPTPTPEPNESPTLHEAEAHHTLEPSPPTFSPTSRPGGPPRNFSDILLPRWQPDSEVTFCPICRTQFSFFVRKHHCRKCGRVVCNACSPHRITIPYQYIVRQPGQARMSQPYLNPLMADDGLPYVSGGERVRLCNPCVPDPNTTPHSAGPSAQRSPRPHYRSQSSSISSGFGGYPPGTSPGFYLQGPALEAYPRGRSITMNAPPPHTSRPQFASTRNQILAGTPPAYYPTAPSPSHYPPGSRARYRALRDPAGASSSTQRPLPPTPQISEEDECPVCHRELPSRTLPNFESLRESHINGCITAHSTYRSRAAGTPTSGEEDGSSTGPPQPVRRTGLFPYVASEKDCVDSAECTICLEEFEAGVRMARLECLCRFHHRCIAAWFVNHPGRCPVHQHDSYGY